MGSGNEGDDGESPSKSPITYGHAQSIWADQHVELLPSGGWRCLWCHKEFKNRHVTRALCHFLKLKGNHISICRAIIPYADLDRYRALRKLYHNHVSAIKRTREGIEDFIDRRQESATNLLLQSKKKVIDLLDDDDDNSLAKSLTYSKKKQRRLSLIQPAVDVSIGNHNLQLLSGSANAAMQMAVADFVQSDGLAFTTGSSIRFRKVIKLAKAIGPDYRMPGRNQISGVLLDKNFEACWNANRDLLLSAALVMGTSWLGDGATIGKKPLVNIMGAAGGIPPVVVGIHDCTQQLVEGGKKDARYISELFKDHMEELFEGSNEPEKLQLFKDTTDVFFFDGASNVQKAGEVLTVHYPRAHCLHGVEHVMALFFSDIGKHPVVQVRFYCNLLMCRLFLTNVVSILFPGTCGEGVPAVQRVQLRG